MSEIGKNQVEKQTPPAADLQPITKAAKTRQGDNGMVILAGMQHFVTLVRKIKHTKLIGEFIESALGSPPIGVLPLLGKAEGSLSPERRDAVFKEVVQLDASVQLKLELISERIDLLCDNYGALAIDEMLTDEEIARFCGKKESPARFDRALYLYLQLTNTVSAMRPDDRFEHAETRQELVRRVHCKKFASHFACIKGVTPVFDDSAREKFKLGLMALFPQIESDDIVIESFEKRDLSKPDQPVDLHTIHAKFNGSNVFYQQVRAGVVHDHETTSLTSLSYALYAEKGLLVVYCDHEEVRGDLAGLFRDVVFDGKGDISTMPMYEFNLDGFRDSEMLARIKSNRIDGIESITIRTITVAKNHCRDVFVKGRAMQRRVSNCLDIRHDRYEDRAIYTVAKDEHHLADLSQYAVPQVKLSMRIARTPHRKSHAVSVNLKVPNDFNEGDKTMEDKNLIYAQLQKLGCAHRY